ncbi:hypothetical protein R1flu_006903 [Riccia fluitans]|uniref:Uncharacterized protein n=1 Tax=Riccia fluitans TaxID=41844 RepID=A0ABD1Z017_9MARC
MEPGPHPLFLIPKPAFRSTDAVWFSKSPVDVNTLMEYTKDMVSDLSGTNMKAITNKSGRGVGITRMVEAGVPTALAMTHTGHRDAKSSSKYDQSSAQAKNWALQRIVAGETSTGKKLRYDDVLREEMKKSEIENSKSVEIVCYDDAKGFSTVLLGVLSRDELSRQNQVNQADRCGYTITDTWTDSYKCLKLKIPDNRFVCSASSFIVHPQEKNSGSTNCVSSGESSAGDGGGVSLRA